MTKADIRRQKTHHVIKRFNELKKPYYRDIPSTPQSPLQDTVFGNNFDNILTPPSSPSSSSFKTSNPLFPKIETNMLKEDFDRPFTNFDKNTNIVEMIPK